MTFNDPPGDSAKNPFERIVTVRTESVGSETGSKFSAKSMNIFWDHVKVNYGEWDT